MADDRLTQWAADLAAALDVEPVLDVDVILGLAADAAHEVVRPAAPVTTFLAGLALGRRGGEAADDVLATIRRQLLSDP